MVEEENYNVFFDVSGSIGKSIPIARRLLKGFNDFAFNSYEEALMIYEEFAPEVIEVERNIKKIEIDLKFCEIQQQKVFKAKGVKTIKEQEQLTKEAMRDVKKQLETYKELRDKLRVKRTILECIIRRGEGI